MLYTYVIVKMLQENKLTQRKGDNMATLFIVWNDGKKESYVYATREEALSAAEGLKKAFGDQVWVGVS